MKITVDFDRTQTESTDLLSTFLHEEGDVTITLTVNPKTPKLQSYSVSIDELSNTRTDMKSSYRLAAFEKYKESIGEADTPFVEPQLVKQAMLSWVFKNILLEMSKEGFSIGGLEELKEDMLEKVDLSELELPVRLVTVLAKANVITLKDLHSQTKTTLGDIEGVNHKSINELLMVLEERGLSID